MILPMLIFSRGKCNTCDCTSFSIVYYFRDKIKIKVKTSDGVVVAFATFLKIRDGEWPHSVLIFVSLFLEYFLRYVCRHNLSRGWGHLGYSSPDGHWRGEAATEVGYGYMILVLYIIMMNSFVELIKFVNMMKERAHLESWGRLWDHQTNASNLTWEQTFIS